jgi:type I restriction enzyme M protein
MLDNETKRRIDTARDILVGKLPDPKSQVEQITIALIYKFMDDMDKEAIEFGGEPTFFTGNYEKYGWSKIFDPRLGGYEMLNLYGEAIQQHNQNPNVPQLFRDIFKNAYLPYRDPETLKLFLKTINEFQYDHSERLGDAFEYLLSVLGSQGDAGQFRTPRHIIDFIVEVIDPQKHETVCDPACGTAGFLISSYKHILKANTSKNKGDLLTPEERTRLANNFVGYDISPDMVRLSLVNMYLHQFPAPNIHEYDTLTSEERWNEYFDVIMANPPFMSPKGGIKPHKKFSLQANRSEVLFVDYIAEHINPTTGRAGVIVPEGIIFQSATAYKSLRKMLVDKNYLYAVVSLPAGVFQPYSGVKTSILLLDKTLAAKTDKILFVKIADDGFGLGAQRKQLQTSDVPDALNLIRDFQAAIRDNDLSPFEDNVELPLGAAAVDKTQIAANGDYNLSGNRYISSQTHNHKFEIVRLGDVILGKPQYGSGASKVEFDGEVRYLRITDIDDDGNLKNKEIVSPSEIEEDLFLTKGDILFARSGSVGRTYLHKSENGKYQFAGYLIRFRVNREKLLPEFLFCVTKSERYKRWIEKMKRSGTISNINAIEYASFEFPLPPLSTQKEIAETIESFQSIIDGAQQVIASYKPQIEIAPEWETVQLGEVGELKNGINYTKESNGAFVQVLGVKDFKNNLYAPLDSFDTVQIDSELSDEYLLKQDDIVFVRSNGNQDLIGRSVIIPKLDFKATFSGFTIRLRFNSTMIYPLFFAHLLKTDFVRKKLVESGTGANIKSLNQASLKNLELPLPPLEVQQEVVARIEREQSLVNANKELITIFEQKITDELNHLWED